MPKTILFVDEEQYVLKAVKRSFRKMREQWHMLFAGSAEEALKLLADEPVDVLVTETRLTGVDGLALLAEVKLRFPQTVRIIMSGYADRDVLLKSVDLAHQYLAKPCEDQMLKATISRAFMMKQLLEADALKALVAQIDALPSLPSLYVELVKELEKEDASIQAIGEIISKDLGMTVKILKLVNSSFFGIAQQVTSPAKAVSLLGLDLVQAMVLSAGAFEKFEGLKISGFSVEQLWSHSMDIAGFAKVIAQQLGLARAEVEMAYMAGLLHDIGKLLLATHQPDAFGQIIHQTQTGQVNFAEAEIQAIGTTHAAIGAYLLGLWGLPDELIDAVAYHHRPGDCHQAETSPLTALHLADAFARLGDRLTAPETIVENTDSQYLDRLGITAQVDKLRRSCSDHLLNG